METFKARNMHDKCTFCVLHIRNETQNQSVMLRLHLATIATISTIRQNRRERERAWSRIGRIVRERGAIVMIVGNRRDRGKIFENQKFCYDCHDSSLHLGRA